MAVEDKDFIGKEYLQNCGDILIVLGKTDQKDKWGKFYFKYRFKKYPYEGISLKNTILTKGVLNPQIEIIEFQEKLWPQYCGDTIKVLGKSSQKSSDGSILFKCEFQKYSCVVLAAKNNIIKGTVSNPQIEIKEFVEKEWLQNCGDVLKIIEKTDKKNGSHWYWKCQFQKYPCEILALKRNIISGSVVNPQIERNNFINKIWLQNCGDKLKIIKKSDKKESNGSNYLFECEFIDYPCKVLAAKKKIQDGVVENPTLPWKTKKSLEEYLIDYYIEHIMDDKDFIGNSFLQNCGDILTILKKIPRTGKCALYEYVFSKYPYKGSAQKVQILKGTVLNPLIEEKEFIGNIFKQNCGDSLRVIEKTSEIANDGHALYKYIFLKYPFSGLALKKSILKGNVVNPEIEKKEFIGNVFEQNCGDSLKVISKEQNGYYLCNFVKYPYKIKAAKGNILIGSVVNPQIEKVEFLDKIWPQNCGDSLKILRKVPNSILFECEFINQRYKIKAAKYDIKCGTVVNPEIERVNFVEKIWPQYCGDSLRIIKKDDKVTNKGYLWEVEFLKYPCRRKAFKNSIIEGVVGNPALPWRSKESLLNYLKENNIKKITLTELAESFGISNSTIGHYINDFGLRDYINYSHFKLEGEVKNFIRLNLNYKNAETKNFPKELNYHEIDIYIPEKQLGFEFNGNYWHSELFKKQDYHQEKSLLFKEKANIELIHIFEYEWLEPVKQNIIKSLIKSKLGIFDKKIGARQCEVRELDNRSYQQFCNSNHLQGEAGAKIKLGLYYNEELVQVMSFSLPRFSDKFEWEIIRECSKLGWQIIGGKEKLWKYFLNKFNPNNCLSYCDFSKFDGHSYLQLGFKQERLNKPGFVWWDEKDNLVYWRDPYHHKEMKEKYVKIWDCGQLVFAWYKENS